MESRIENIESFFSIITDPRKQINQRHKLIDIIVISICGMLSGCESFVEIAEYGKIKAPWLKTFLELPRGIPSHDVINEVFRYLDPDDFPECFHRWVKSLQKEVLNEIIAIAGKTLRRSFDKATQNSAFHLVSAWASENKLILGQVSVADKSNEITAIPELLKLLDVKNCVVTIDAMGCQKEIAKLILAKKGDYVLSLKGNQGNLHEQVKVFFEKQAEKNYENLEYDYYETVAEKNNHGRKEVRKYLITADWSSIPAAAQWQGLISIGKVDSERTVNGATVKETRYFIASIKANAELFAKAVRKHWGIENSVHWVLDVIFNEDYSRVRKNNAAHNLAALRKIALNLIRAENQTKGSIRVKRMRSGLDDDYLLKVLTSSRVVNSSV